MFCGNTYFMNQFRFMELSAFVIRFRSAAVYHMELSPAERDQRRSLVNRLGLQLNYRLSIFVTGKIHSLICNTEPLAITNLLII